MDKMTHDELLAEIDERYWKMFNHNSLDQTESSIEHRTFIQNQYFALRAVVELHKPYDSQDTPHELAMGWCKGCSIEYSIKEYASQPYPCPTIQKIMDELK